MFQSVLDISHPFLFLFPPPHLTDIHHCSIWNSDVSVFLARDKISHLFHTFQVVGVCDTPEMPKTLFRFHCYYLLLSGK